MKPAAPAHPRKVGAYDVLGEIAHGGMGVVYRVRDPKLGREVALKMMIGGAWNGEQAQRRFLREAHILAELSHPGIIPIHDIGIEEGNPYYTMDLVTGETLDRHVAHRGLSTAQRLRLFILICEAIHYAHMKGVIHRDLKPGNILINASGRPVVLDFGLARDSVADAGAQAMTVSGAVMGTPAYMAPEQAQGRIRDIDARTDVYALGVILYELVTGEPPFQAEDPYALMKAVVEQDAPAPSTLIRVARDLEAVILKALRKSSDERYASAHALAEDVRRFLAGHAVEAHPDTAFYRVRKWAQRHRELAVSIAVGVFLVVSVSVWGVVGVLREGRRAREERDKALQAEKQAHHEMERAVQAEQRAHDEMARAQDAERKAMEALRRLEDEVRLRREAEAGREAEAIRRERRLLAERLLVSADRLSRPEEALKLVDQAIGEDPDHAQAHWRRGILLVALGQANQALPAFDRALELDPANVKAHVDRGLALRAAGLSKPALQALDKAIETDPAYGPAYAARASLKAAAGQAEEALKDLDRALELEPGDQAVRLERAHLRRGQGLLPSALADLDLVIAADPARADLHAERGDLLALQNRVEAAIEAYEAALERNPKDPRTCVSLALVLRKRGKLVEAQKAFDRAIQADPAYADAHYQRGLYLREQKNAEEALKAFLRAAEADAGHALCRYHAAQILQGKQRLKEAVELYEKAWSLGLPKDLDEDAARQVEAIRKPAVPAP